MGCHSLLQGIFLTQGSNLGLLHCRQILYCLNHQGYLNHFAVYLKHHKSTILQFLKKTLKIKRRHDQKIQSFHSIGTRTYHAAIGISIHLQSPTSPPHQKKKKKYYPIPRCSASQQGRLGCKPSAMMRCHKNHCCAGFSKATWGEGCGGWRPLEAD